MKRALILTPVLAVAFAALAAPALAGPVNLLPDPVDDDGRITLGELFDDAGAASNVVVGRRAGATAVLEASQVQIAARRAGLEWSNPTGLRRIVVREGGALSGGGIGGVARVRPFLTYTHRGYRFTGVREESDHTRRRKEPSWLPPPRSTPSRA